MPTLFEKYSNSNIANSLAVELAGNLITEGYLVYWHPTDSIQTNDGVYFGWSQNYTVYMADAVFSADVAASKGIITLVEHIPVNPTWLERPISGAQALPQDHLYIPVLSVEVGPVLPIRNYELGSTQKWRTRHLVIDGYVRSKKEQRELLDVLAKYYDNESMHAIQNHDDTTLTVVGDVECIDSATDSSISPVGLEPTTYQVILNARLQYIA